MGCGNSKLAPEGEVVPPRIRPLLRRRFLEIKKRRNGNVLKDGGLSKKNLLKDGEDEDDSHSSPPHSEIVDSKSTSSSLSSSSEKKEKLPEKPESTEKAIKDLKEQDNKEAESTLVKKNVDITSSSKKEDKEDKENVKRGEKDKPKIGGELKQKEATREKEEDDDEDEDDEGAGEDDRFICPGSPSFRVYFLDAAENEKKKIAEEEDEDEDEDAEDDSPQKKTQSDDSFGSNESAASNTAEERKSSKKGRRGRAFRRAIKKGGPVAVKNLLNVKSCYHPGCASGSGHDRATLLDGKTAAA